MSLRRGVGLLRMPPLILCVHSNLDRIRFLKSTAAPPPNKPMSWWASKSKINKHQSFFQFQKSGLSRYTICNSVLLGVFVLVKKRVCLYPQLRVYWGTAQLCDFFFFFLWFPIVMCNFQVWCIRQKNLPPDLPFYADAGGYIWPIRIEMQAICKYSISSSFDRS